MATGDAVAHVTDEQSRAPMEASEETGEAEITSFLEVAVKEVVAHLTDEQSRAPMEPSEETG